MTAPRKRPVNSGGKQGGPRFTKGQSGNPAGRPRGSRSLGTKLLDEIGAEAAGDILSRMVRKAKRGDAQAAQLILSRCWPAPKGRTVQIKLPKIATAADAVDAMSALVAAVAAGEIGVDDARGVADLVRAFVGAVDAAEYNGRLESIERVLGIRDQQAGGSDET